VETISLARGVPAPECLPAEDLAECARAVVERDGEAVLNYGPAGGYGPLREWVAERHGVAAGRVIITNGSLQGFVFLAGALAPRGPILVEAPTYDRPLRLLDGLGAEVFALRVDEGGLEVDLLEVVLRQGLRPAFLYTIPTFQNPTGRTLDAERRRRLVQLAAHYGLLIVEDDPYGLVRFEGPVMPTLFELAGAEQVVYASSFSKTVAPGLRVGYLVLPEALVADVETAAASTYITPSLLPQATLFEYLRLGCLRPNLDRTCRLLRERRDALLAALAGELPEGRWSRPAGGYFLWLELPGGVLVADVVARASSAGVAFVPGTDFFPPGAGGENALRLAYSFASPRELAEGAVRLGAAVRGGTLRRAA
jgi:2-aminoadipate transaminase